MSVASLRIVRRSNRALIAGLVGVVLSAPAYADDHAYVQRDGRKIAMTRSDTEYGVILHRCDDADACAERLAAKGLGKLKKLEKAGPTARVRLMEVAKTGAARRKSIAQDPAVEDVRPVYRFAGSSLPVIGTGTAVVKVHPRLSDIARKSLWDNYAIADVKPLEGQPHVYLVTPIDEDGEVGLAERLAGDRRVLWAQPNLRRPTEARQVTPPTPQDPFYGRQWHLNNTGQLGGAVNADIDALEAWAISTGEGILFGTFDTGCDVDHEDLRDNYIGFGQDATLEEGFEGADDPRPKSLGDSHSTSVMGLAVAGGNNVGGRGVAYNAQFTASRGLNDFLTDVEIARVFNFAIKNDVDVHVNSWGFFNVPNPEVIVDLIQLAFREGRNKGDLDGDGDDDPLGMVIMFASGNEGIELQPGLELSVLPEVIGIGGSGDQDELVCYSNYGSGIDVLAPTQGCDFESQALVTTDNTDGLYIDSGYNIGGFDPSSGEREADPDGSYTQFFNGTSGACPIAAGVAGLILSVNPMLTATDVRLILEHTADRIESDLADYNGTTNRSLTHGYGRVNAGGAGESKLGAVEAAQETLTNGGVTWPDRPADVRVEGVFLRWRQNFATDEFLVVRSNDDFEFIPEDGACYDAAQSNCVDIRNLPGGVQVLAVGCGLSCDDSVPGTCITGADQCVEFPAVEAGQMTRFAIYARNTLGRYSFGVAADSTGDVVDAGTVVGEESGGPSDGGEPPPAGPAVTINVSPLSGLSPLTVHFSGNAVSELPIDESRTTWDFDVDDATAVDATTRTATHTYFVADGQVRTFVARLTMYDTEGNSGFAEAGIRVEGKEIDDDPTVATGDFRIVIGLPNTPGSDVDEGPSPFSVLLSIEATDLQATPQSISWDLGDGTRATSFEVPHTYINDGDEPLRLPITATLIGVTGGGASVNTVVTRLITINPGAPVVDPGDPNLPGTTPRGEGGPAGPCGPVGMIPVLFIGLGLSLLRRRR